MAVRPTLHIDAAAIVLIGLALVLIVLIGLGQSSGWAATWRSFNVTPLQPHFFDMHVLADYAACAARGLNAYIPHACNQDNFNVPPVWLLLGNLGANGSDAPWLSAVFIAAALVAFLAHFRGRPPLDGAFALLAVLSPSVMMGVERANSDLLIFGLVGAAAVIYSETSLVRLVSALALLGLGVVLKLFPVFGIWIGARLARRALLFSVILALLSVFYTVAIFKYILLIRHNVPTTFMLSYGYKAIFLGLDHMRGEASLNPLALTETWVPIVIAASVLTFAAATALACFYGGRVFCHIGPAAAGTAFFFGSGIYCGTYLLGTNFIYRLMFLLLCLPQLLDWQRHANGASRRASLEGCLLAIVMAVLWLNGDANGHTTFLLIPQLIDWALFYGLSTVLMLNFFSNVARVGGSVSAVDQPASAAK